MPKFVDLTGQSYGEWNVISYIGTKRALWLSVCCICGEKKVLRGESIRDAEPSNREKGCWTCRRKKHGHSSMVNGASSPSPEYRAWKSIKTRCLNPNISRYMDYGGRGIKICDEWINDFAAFLNYVGPRPSPRHSIDRYPNNDGNYEPGNVRWATDAEQSRNRKNTKLTSEDAKFIRHWSDLGYRHKLIAKTFGLHHKYVSALSRNKAWTI